MVSIPQIGTTLTLVTFLVLFIFVPSFLSLQALAQDTDSSPRSLKIQLPRIFDWNGYKVSGKLDEINLQSIKNDEMIKIAAVLFFGSEDILPKSLCQPQR